MCSGVSAKDWDARAMESVDLISRLVDNLVECTLVGDGKKPMPADIVQNTRDPDEAFRAYLARNNAERDTLKRQMTPEQISIALTLYQVWFRSYLTTDSDPDERR